MPPEHWADVVVFPGAPSASRSVKDTQAGGACSTGPHPADFESRDHGSIAPAPRPSASVTCSPLGGARTEGGGAPW